MRKLDYKQTSSSRLQIIRNSNYDYLEMEKYDFIKRFGDNCVDSFVNQMLEMESYLKYYIENKNQKL